MAAFSSFRRKLLNPDGTDAGAKLVDFIERHSEWRLDFKGPELICEVKRLFGKGDCPVLDQGNVVLRQPLAAGLRGDCLIEVNVKPLEHERMEFLRRFGRDQGFLLFLLRFAGVLPRRADGVQP